MARLKLALLLSAAVFCFGFQQAPEGTAAHCDNYHATPQAHRCSCGRAMMHCEFPGDTVDEPGPKCKTYCKPERCFCKGTNCSSGVAKPQEPRS